MRRSAARVPHLRGRRVARASGAPSRDALRGVLRCDAKRTLDCAFARAWIRRTRREVRVSQNGGREVSEYVRILFSWSRMRRRAIGALIICLFFLEKLMQP